MNWGFLLQNEIQDKLVIIEGRGRRDCFLPSKGTWFRRKNTIRSDWSVVDSSDLGNEKRLVTDLADDAAHGIGNKATLQTTHKSTLVGAINEVFQTGNNVKSNTVDALLSVDDSLPITSNDSWQNVINAIGEIRTGINFAAGELESAQGSGNITTITGLSFIPKVIIVSSRSTTNGLGNPGPYNTVLGLYGRYNASNDELSWTTGIVGSGTSPIQILVPSSNGFSFHVWDTWKRIDVKWLALENTVGEVLN